MMMKIIIIIIIIIIRLNSTIYVVICWQLLQEDALGKIYSDL